MFPPPDSVIDALTALLGTREIRFEPIAGHGCAAKLAEGPYFLRWARDGESFEAEVAQLRDLAERWELQTPTVVAFSTDPAFLLTDWVDAAASLGGDGFGRALARSHRASRGPRIDPGALYRVRAESAFDAAICANRISPCLSRKTVTILHRWERWFEDAETESVFVHGDLRPPHVRSGPTVVSPEAELGSREYDVALFDRSPSGFVEAYRTEWPLPEGFARRRWLFRLISRLELLNRGRLSADAVEECVKAIIASS